MKKLVLSFSLLVFALTAWSQHPLSTAYITPNPVDDKAIVAFEQPLHESVLIVVKDLTGKVMYTHQTDSGSDSINEVRINLEELSRGIYILQVSVAEGKIKTLKFQKN
ncbi:MAG: T9SS type A sorting domain-containing protein [Flavobacteriales bacterium]|nr:T9SS type A sorting domain-containing protein [Flavobacteriales bacterium]